MTRYTPTQAERPLSSRHARYDHRVLGLLASRLTERDRWIIHLLWNHHVLTTPQLAQLAYHSHSRARHGMLRLARYGCVERFRPLLPVGSSPLHYVIGEAGARVLAAETGQTLTELGYRRDRVLGIAYSPRLTHTVGINNLFAALVDAARRDGTARLRQWWPEQRCMRTWGAYVRPDAYGHWSEHGREVDFFIEYDLATEPLARVAAKLDAYAALADTTGVTRPVLIWTTSASREAHLRRHLRGTAVPVATTTPDADPERLGPAGSVWLTTAPRSGARLRLIDLARFSRRDPPSSSLELPEADHDG